MAFSSGVPVRAHDRDRGSDLQAALAAVSRFLILCASSRIATPHVFRRGPQFGFGGEVGAYGLVGGHEDVSGVGPLPSCAVAQNP